MKRFLQTLVGDIELNRDLSLLLLIGGLYSLGIALSNTFVNVYLWKQSGEYVDIALYNLAVVILQPLTFLLAGRWAKKIDRVIVLRLGVIFLSIFFTTVLMMGENAGKYLLVLGALLGIGYGFYWLSFNVLTFEITEPETRDFFNGFLGILTSFAGMIGPIGAGFIITHMEKLTGYRVIFAISLGLFLLAVVLSFFLNRRSAEGGYHLKDIWSLKKEDSNWKAILYAHFFQGLREGTFIFLIVVWIYVATGSELALGTYGLVASAVAFICYYLTGRFVKPALRKRAILIGGLMLYGAIFLIIFELNFALLLTYGVVVSIAYPLLLVPYVSLTYDVIGNGWKAAEMRVEYIVVRELFLNFGRITSIVLFIGAVLLMGDRPGIPIVLLILGAGHTIIYWVVRKIQLPHAEHKETFSVMKKR
ncbi:MFS transporter [Alteribacter lacisalsi]|jgi:MFS transporter, YQGE family, putative transporter|uniref:MFS transporter n=1 Tax=Alteribacter lacisalsi TaxID=2045244 RepID=A0A2W0HCN7_9BACI|nr:MFS transporter [Alteribacter lacisalsi]PYZ98636.1 MFS transporter [Alteribacter lacisalsi]